MDSVKFGVTTLPIPEKILSKAQWLVPKSEPKGLKNTAAAIKKAINSPIGCKSLKELVKPQDKVSIIVSDLHDQFQQHRSCPRYWMNCTLTGLCHKMCLLFLR